MNRSRISQEDFEFLLANARAARAAGITDIEHLDQPIGIWNYIRIADDMARQVPPGDLLDWGCGLGHMTYLLKRRGFRVVSYDVGEPGKLPAMPLCQDLDVVYATHPTNLPFADRSFDAVLSCGVLEHVDEMSQPGNERKSLFEIARVLRPNGLLFVNQLPQRYAWQEAIIRRLGLGYAHPRRFVASEITKLLEETGYTVQSLHRVNLFPKNLTAMPTGVRNLYSRFSTALIALDGALCRIPGLNHLAGGLEVTARRDSA